MPQTLTLCIVHKGAQVLLGMKKRGFGQGNWNGFGGKLHEGESIEDAARREVREEAGILVKDLEKVGILTFAWEKNPDLLEVHVFRVEDFEGEPTEGEEMRPKWFTEDALPYKEMWPDDVYWLPLLLAGKKFRGAFLFGEANQILSQELQEVEEI